ncbi:MAG: hypothetical protein ACKPKO_00200, partial [Candidatus Fonsibacter sp.]
MKLQEKYAEKQEEMDMMEQIASEEMRSIFELRLQKVIAAKDCEIDDLREAEKTLREENQRLSTERQEYEHCIKGTKEICGLAEQNNEGCLKEKMEYVAR